MCSGQSCVTALVSPRVHVVLKTSKRLDWCYIQNEDGVEVMGLKIIVEVCRVVDLKVPKMFHSCAIKKTLDEITFMLPLINSTKDRMKHNSCRINRAIVIVVVWSVLKATMLHLLLPRLNCFLIRKKHE